MFYQIYNRGCPSNLNGLEPSLAFCMIYLSEYLLQIIVLYIQYKLGPRSFIPKCFLPKQYNYYRALNIQEDYEECAICLTSLMEDPFDTQVPTEKLILKQAMQTPCNHWFHPSCLRSWIDIKMQCPTCRSELQINIKPFIHTTSYRMNIQLNYSNILKISIYFLIIKITINLQQTQIQIINYIRNATSSSQQCQRLFSQSSDIQIIISTQHLSRIQQFLSYPSQIQQRLTIKQPESTSKSIEEKRYKQNKINISENTNNRTNSSSKSRVIGTMQIEDDSLQTSYNGQKLRKIVGDSHLFSTTLLQQLSKQNLNPNLTNDSQSPGQRKPKNQELQNLNIQIQQIIIKKNINKNGKSIKNNYQNNAIYQMYTNINLFNLLQLMIYLLELSIIFLK